MSRTRMIIAVERLVVALVRAAIPFRSARYNRRERPPGSLWKEFKNRSKQELE
jgi:hypothetical protein